MDIICSKFPALGQQIFCNLDNENLIKCKNLGKTWSEFIEKEKFIQIRFITKYITNHKDYKDIWKVELFSLKSYRQDTQNQIYSAGAMEERVKRMLLHPSVFSNGS